MLPCRAQCSTVIAVGLCVTAYSAFCVAAEQLPGPGQLFRGAICCSSFELLRALRGMFSTHDAYLTARKYEIPST